jgi:hypothetical protein
MDKDDQYRKQAADARAMAERTMSATDKEAWLRLSQGWLSLIRKPRPPAQEGVATVVQEMTAQQDHAPANTAPQSATQPSFGGAARHQAASVRKPEEQH